MYKLPSVAGTYVAELIDSFFTCSYSMDSCYITSAAISPDNKKVILLGHDQCWLFTNFIGNHFFHGDVAVYHFPFSTQKEGITFLNNDELYICDEYTNQTGKKLYYFFLPTSASLISPIENEEIKFTIAPNPSSGSINIFTTQVVKKEILIYNSLGRMVKKFSSFENQIKIERENLPNGIYFVEIIFEKENKVLKAKMILE